MDPIEVILRRAPFPKKIKSIQLDANFVRNGEETIHTSFQCHQGKFICEADLDHLNVFSKQNGYRIGSFAFGQNSTISCISSSQDSDLLFIGIDYPSGGGGEIVIFNPFLSIRLKRISLPRVPTKIVPIFDSFSDVNKICFHPKIANCPSLLSVACCDEVYLLSYELNGGLSCRAESVSKCAEVNEFVQNSNSQLLKLKLKYSFSEITTLSFDKRASFIFVGTKCGKVAFYSVKDLRVMWFNHNKDSEFGEIKSLFFQEPENDPKRNGWVWQCAQRDDNLLQLELYSLEFDRSDPLKNPKTKKRETFYSMLSRVVGRFSYARKGILTKSFPIEQYGKYEPTDWSDWCGACPQASLAAFGVRDDKFRIICFDLNRYYNARCPGHLGTRWDRHFFTIVTVSPDHPFTYRIDPNSLVSFKSGQCGGGILETDELYSEPNEPSSVSFQVELIYRDLNAVYFDVHDIMGKQENALYCLAQQDGGVGTLCDPDAAFKRLELSGLTQNKFKQKIDQISLKDAIQCQNSIKKREAVLDSALSFGQLPTLRLAFVAARDNELAVRGIAPEMLEMWCIRKVHQLKAKLNSILHFIFLSDEINNQNTVFETKMVAIQTQLSHLSQILKIMSDVANPKIMTLQTSEGTDLNQRYIHVLRWLVKVKVLPECQIETGSSIWSYDKIKTKIENLRRQFRSWTGNTTSALMIDMICDLIPSDLKSGWTNHSAIKTTNQKAGVYPPTSIKILLDLLLSRIVQPELSCTILFYLMLDLLEMTSSSGNRDVITVDEHFLETFGSALRINQGLIDYAIGCWNLDNGRGEEAVRVFLSSGCITPITISHWKNIIYQLLSFGLSSDALRFLKIPIPEPSSKTEYLEILNAKIDIYLANKKCRQCWLLIRTVPDRKIRIEKFGFFIRESIHLNLESQIIGLPLNSEENEVVIREMKINQKPDLFQICKLYHTKSSRSTSLREEPIKLLDFKSKSSQETQNCFTLNEMNEKLIEETKNLFESPSLEQMKLLREEERSNIPDLPPSSPSRGLLKTSSSQNSELSSLSASEANSQSTTSTVKSNKRVLRFQKDVEDREDEQEEEEAVTLIEEDHLDDINTENDEEVTEDDEEMEVDPPEVQNDQQEVQENNDIEDEDLEELSHSQTLYGTQGDTQESTNQKSAVDSQSEGEIVFSSQESLEVRKPMRDLSMEGITVIESSGDEDEKNEDKMKEPEDHLSEDKLYNESIYLSPETSISEANDARKEQIEEFEEVKPEDVKPNSEKQKENISEELLSEEIEEKISEDFERISEEIENENLKTLKELKENDDLTEGDLQVLAEGDQATDMESEAPSIPVGFEIRKGSPSSLKIIQKDISKEMGTDVAEAVGLEFNCVDSDRSDNEVIIEEKPHIPEVTYDGDKEDEEDLEDHDEDNQDDSAKDETEPLISVGSVLTKDTSMDGERMTVSDEESIVGTDSRIATTGAAELKMQEIVQEESPSADDAIDEPVMKPPKTPEAVKKDKEKSEVLNDDEKVPEKEVEKLEPVKKGVTRRMTRSRNNSQETKITPEVVVHPAVNLDTITEDKSKSQSEMEVEESDKKDEKLEEIQEVEEVVEDKQKEELNSEIKMTQSTGRKVSVNLERVKTPSTTRRGRSRQNSEEKEIVKTDVSLNLVAITEEQVNEDVKETEEKIDEKKTRRGGRTKKKLEIDLEKAKPARKTATKKSKKKNEILELDFDPIQMLEEVDSKEGKELKSLAAKLNVEWTAALTKSTKALLCKRIKTALKEQIEARDDLPEEKDNSPEIVQKFINTTPSQKPSAESPTSTTPPSDVSDVQEKEINKKKPRRAKDRAPSTPRRSSRIRQRSGSQSESGQSDAESEDGSKGNIERPSQKVDPLPALEEDKEIVFSPPRSKQSSKSIPVSAENLQSSEPKFSLPKRTRKRSANEVDDVTDSPAKKTRQTPVKTRPETPSTPRRSARRIRQPNI